MSVTKSPPAPRADRLRGRQIREVRSIDPAKGGAAPEAHRLAGLVPRQPSAVADEGRNLLFVGYPVRLARELLGLDVTRMAMQFGFTKTEWMRIEANLHILPAETRCQIEEFVRDQLAEICRP